MHTLITICRFSLLLSQHTSLLGLIPQDLYQWYHRRYALHGNEGFSIVRVQISSWIFNLLLAHLESICWAIHCKHHIWSSGTTSYLSCSRKFHDLYNILCCSTNPWHLFWLSTLWDQALFHPIWPWNGLKSFLHAYWSLRDLIPAPYHPIHSGMTIT